jgi:hypothetical protein
MDLNHFGHFFEIFTGLNLGYAGSKTFQNTVNERFLSLDRAITDRLKRDVDIIKSQLVVTLAERSLSGMQSKVETIEKEFNDKLKKYEDREEHFRKFPEGCKSMFLASGFLCLFVILFGGYEQFLPSSATINFTLFLCGVILIYNLLIFLKSFSYDNCHKNQHPKYPITILFVVVFFAVLSELCVVNSDKHTNLYEFGILPQFTLSSGNSNDKWAISICILSVCSPFLLHFFRVFIHKQFFRMKLHWLSWNTSKKLKPIQEAIKALSPNDEPN